MLMQFGSHVPEKTQTRQCCGHAPYQSPLMNNKSQHRAQHQHLHDIASQHQQQHSSKPILTSKQNRAFIEGMIWFKIYIYIYIWKGVYIIYSIYITYMTIMCTHVHTLFLPSKGPSIRTSPQKGPLPRVPAPNVQLFVLFFFTLAVRPGKIRRIA